MVSHYVKIKVESESKIKALNLILKNNIKYSKLKIMSDGALEIKLTYKDANLLIKELEEARNADAVKNETAKEIKKSLANFEDQEYQNIPVISTISGNNNFLFQKFYIWRFL